MSVSNSVGYFFAACASARIALMSLGELPAAKRISNSITLVTPEQKENDWKSEEEQSDEKASDGIKKMHHGILGVRMKGK